MKEDEVLYDVLDKELKPALGCTEPAAVTYACAVAAKVLECPVEKVEIAASKNILKNVMGVGIPNTDSYGITTAAAMGVQLKNIEKKLMILKDATPDIQEKAGLMVRQNRIEVCETKHNSRIRIEVTCYGEGHESRVIIDGMHTNIISVRKDGRELVLGHQERSPADETAEIDLSGYTIRDFCEFVSMANPGRLEATRKAVQLSKALSEKGLKGDYGLGVGRALKNMERQEEPGLVNYVKYVTAAAADARMAGCELPAMSLCGSGNQCIEATLPVAAVAEREGFTTEEMIRAAALSQLITVYTKRYTGRLSPICGCGLAAAIGAAAAITWLKHGTDKMVESAVKNVAADLSGMICDGAKPGCSLKLATAAGTAVQSAMLALGGISATDRDGIVAESAEMTIQNLGILDRDGMNCTDQVILDLMLGQYV